MHLAAIAYNLKKYMKFEEKRVNIIAKATCFFESIKNYLVSLKPTKINTNKSYRIKKTVYSNIKP